MKESIQLLQKVFRLRTCEDTVFANRTRPCLLYQIKRCSGPCVNLVSAEDYRATWRMPRPSCAASSRVLQALQARMMAHAEALEFEQAAELRNQIGALSKVLHQQSVENPASDKDVDILAVQGAGRQGLRQPGDGARRPPPGRPAYFPKHVEDAAAVQDFDDASRGGAGARPVEVQVLEAFIAQHYIGVPVPPR